jgi:hypothetical protein
MREAFNLSASTHIGRIGMLAAALGVGAAVLTGPGVARADSTSDATDSTADSSTGAAASRGGDEVSVPSHGHRRGSAQTNPTNAAPSRPGANAEAAQLGTTTAVTPFQGPTSRGRGVAALPVAAQSPDVGVPRAGLGVRPNNDPAPAATMHVPAADVAALSAGAASPAPVAALTAAPLAALPAASVPTDVVGAPVEPVTSNAVVSAARPSNFLTDLADQISTAITSMVNQLVHSIFGNSPLAPRVDSPADWLLLAAARRVPLAAATSAAVVSTPATPTLVLNGYNVVATSVEIVDAFTGRWTTFPGVQSMEQGRQDFALVNPATNTVVGNFSALVTAGDPTALGARYVQLLVTGNDGANVGTGPGQTPPVGSLISDFSFFGLGGLSYSAMPSPTGAKVSTKLRTPFGSFALPITYDVSAGIADHTFDNRPVQLGGGFTLAPADPAAEIITGTIGLPPGFNSVQGRQQFGIFDAAGRSVGSFEGVFTTTGDILGFYTQAILVTANDGINVGARPGQTPTVGTVYNVIYVGGDNLSLLYSSIPQPTGTAITISLRTPLGVVDLPPALFNSFNASVEPPLPSLTAPGGQKFVATSSFLPFGVNGLPPREMETQGYQQFDVYDAFGRKMGSVAADVSSQWDLFGVQSKALLITKVNGTAGSGPASIPSVGTKLDFVYFPGGLGYASAVVPVSDAATLNWFSFITPFGNVPVLPVPQPIRYPAKVDYFNPFLL